MSDLISKHAALDVLEWKWAGKAAIDAIKGLPTIDSVKHGKWIEQKVTHDDNRRSTIIADWQSAKCSNCGKYHTTPYLYYFRNYNYCPNCGAKMDGGEE